MQQGWILLGATKYNTQQMQASAAVAPIITTINLQKGRFQLYIRKKFQTIKMKWANYEDYELTLFTGFRAIEA